MPVVFVTRTLHPHDKERYLAVGQPLVVPGKFAYLPFAGTKQDDARKPFVMTRETLAPMPASKALGLAFVATGRALWEKAQPFLVSPVKRTVGLLCAPCAEEGGVVAGADALAEISQLNVQEPKEFALPLEGFAKRGLEVVSTLGAPYRLQLWAYSPTRLGGSSVDVLSLVLSLRGVTDDRVQIEIDRLLEEFKW